MKPHFEMKVTPVGTDGDDYQYYDFEISNNFWSARQNIHVNDIADVMLEVVCEWRDYHDGTP